MSDWAKELLADVARDFAPCGAVKVYTPDAIQKLLERRLLGLLKAGQRYRDVVDTQDEKSAACDALWDAAKAVASEGKARCHLN